MQFCPLTLKPALQAPHATEPGEQGVLFASLHACFAASSQTFAAVFWYTLESETLFKWFSHLADLTQNSHRLFAPL